MQRRGDNVEKDERAFEQYRQWRENFLIVFFTNFRSFRESSSKEIDFAHRLGALARLGVKSYALLKFQPPTMLGDHQNVEKTIWKKIDFFGFRKSIFRNFSWILERIGTFQHQNHFPREILLQMHLF